MKPPNRTRKSGNREIDALIQRGISERIFPGAVAYIAEGSTIPYCEAFGSRMCIPDIKPMQRDTIFDLASLTKPVVIVTLIMRLVEEGMVELDETLQKLSP